MCVSMKKNTSGLIPILVTGGCGFIGSNFIPFFLEKHSHYHVINLDKLTYAARRENVHEVENNPRYTFVEGDISNRLFVETVFSEYHIQAVIHFAAESHVDNSIKVPDIFIKTNVEGTFTLLDVAKNYWMEAPHRVKTEHLMSRFHHISTDEVYGSLSDIGVFTEKTPYAPNSPYSASKAASDFLVRSYFHTYGLNTVISNCSNNYGPRQHVEKLIPTIISKAIHLEEIPIYGSGKNVRDWIYVLDHCKAVDLIFHKGKSGESYNIGARNEQDNITIARRICRILDDLAPEYKKNSAIKKYDELISFVTDRPGHDFRYAIDPFKIESELGWHPEETFDKGLEKTVRWYLQKFR
jgi:dTDP-glucose 4,6-dehydratase